MKRFSADDLVRVTDVNDGVVEYDSLPQSLKDDLFEYFCYNGMPYGVAKARTGDPDQYIVDHLGEIIFEAQHAVVA
jgi:hypothetical protein